MRGRTSKIAFIGVISAIALILSYIEVLLPPIYAAVPGVKVGLPNIVILFTLYRFGVKEAALVSIVRILLSSLLFGFNTTFFYSLAGAAISLLVMALLKRLDAFSSLGVSVAGAISHNLGQVLVAMLMLQTVSLGYYMLVLAVSGSLAGVFVGLLAELLLRSAEKIRFK